MDVKDIDYAEAELKVAANLNDYPAEMTIPIGHSTTDMAKLLDKIQSEARIESMKNNLKIRIPYRRVNKKVGRNAPCTCGSALKYKKCCGRNDG